MAKRAGLLAAREAAGATTRAPPLRREHDADDAESRARVTDGARVRLAGHGRLHDPTAGDLHRDTRLGILTIFAPVGLMSVAHARVCTTATILPSLLTMA